MGKASALAGLSTAIDAEIARLEAELTVLLAATEGTKPTQIPGVGPVTAAGCVAFVGSAMRWSQRPKVWPAGGLDPARAPSGPKDVSYSISREGSAWGRRALLDLATSAWRSPGRWRDACRERLTAGKKPPVVAIAAAGNSIGRTGFALMATGADYDPDHEASRRRLAEGRPDGAQDRIDGRAREAGGRAA